MGLRKLEIEKEGWLMNVNVMLNLTCIYSKG